MKKKLALIVISLDECFTQKGFSGGGHKVTKNIIQSLISSGKFDIDIFCKKSTIDSLEGIDSIKVLNKKTFVKDLERELALKKYDYVLSSDVLLPFGNLVLHSNSAKFKTKNGKSKFLERILSVYNAKKIKVQEKCFAKNDKHIFTVSSSLKRDYVENYALDENKVFACYPAVDEAECVFSEQKTDFTIGGMAGGGLNKGGYLLLFAINKFKNALVKNERIKNFKARIIFPKIHKAGFFKLLIKLLNLSDTVELLPRQEDMQKFYQSIDCYVLPSLNEAFGLVVTEAASNGKPSLISSTTGAKDIIVDGENGFVFDRTKTPLKNLADGLKRVHDIYFSDHSKFVEISKNACETSKSLDWKKFTDTIIENLKEE